MPGPSPSARLSPVSRNPEPYAGSSGLRTKNPSHRGSSRCHSRLGKNGLALQVDQRRRVVGRGHEPRRMVQRQQFVKRRRQHPHLLSAHRSKRHISISPTGAASKAHPTTYPLPAQTSETGSVRYTLARLTGVRTTRGPMNCCPRQPALGPPPRVPQFFVSIRNRGSWFGALTQKARPTRCGWTTRSLASYPRPNSAR